MPPDLPPSVSPFTALEVMQDLSDALLAGHSATLTLEAWVGGEVSAHRVDDEARPAPAGLRERLGAAADELIAYRHVRLMAEGYVLSEAQNWYLPSRLTAAMRDELAAGDAPFGRVILPLQPVRETTGVTMFWNPSEDGPDMPLRLFEHRARVFAGDDRPLAEVVEAYSRDAVLLRLAAKP
jgi:chorismate-pyruvate lyase